MADITVATCESLPKDVIAMQGASGWTFIRSEYGIIKCKCGGVIFTPRIENEKPYLNCNRCGEQM